MPPSVEFDSRYWQNPESCFSTDTTVAAGSELRETMEKWACPELESHTQATKTPKHMCCSTGNAPSWAHEESVLCFTEETGNAMSVDALQVHDVK